MRLQSVLTEPANEPVVELSPARASQVGEGFTVRRALPTRGRRCVGAWCFLDHFGPAAAAGDGSGVGPHPHIGLSTVTWLISGEMVHKDSLGTEQVIRSGQLNWMTSGHGITHSEEGVVGYTGPVHGVQLWVALPDTHRDVAPSFEHHPTLPVLRDAVATTTVIVGRCGGARSPATTFSPLLGVDVAFTAAGTAAVDVDPEHEHALVALDGEVAVDGTVVRPGTLAYLGTRRREIAVSAVPGARAMIVGGAPLREPLLLWWNFVARTHEEIAEARARWADGDAAFGSVPHYTRGPRLEAPSLR